jgi:hypothetical protein
MLLVEGRKLDSLMIQLSTNAHCDVDKLVVVTTMYDAKCEEIQLLQAKMRDLNNIDEGVGDDGNSPSSSIPAADDSQHDGHVANRTTPSSSSRSRVRVPARNVRRHAIPVVMGSHAAYMAHAKTCKEVERLNELDFAAHGAIDATVQIKPRTRAHKGKASSNDLIKKITNVSNMLKKKTDECENLVKEVDLEKKDSEDMLK